MAAKGIQFPWRWGRGTISTKLDVIWEMSDYTPKHPYTEALMSAIPDIDPDRQMTPVLLSGERPNPADPPPGYRFHTRCRYADETCRTTQPALREIESGHFVSCHYAETLELKGALVQSSGSDRAAPDNRRANEQSIGEPS